jgi:hypothetical protein
MQIVFHLGAHATDDDRLVRALLKNRGTLEAAGISVPTPRLYRQMLPRVAKSLKGGLAGAESQQVILDAVMEMDEAHRVVFSNETLICFPVNVVSQFGFYQMMPQRLAAYSNLFPEAKKEFFLALRNPATLVPALIERAAGGTYEKIMADTNPMDLRWASVIRRVVAHMPDINLTIWCNEDVPLIWPEVLRALAGLSAEDALEGDFDLLATIMTEEGLIRLKAYFDAHPPKTVAQRRRVTTSFLEKFAKPEEIEIGIDLPGWTDALIAEITDAYDADCAEIANMPGVTFIAP